MVAMNRNKFEMRPSASGIQIAVTIIACFSGQVEFRNFVMTFTKIGWNNTPVY